MLSKSLIGGIAAIIVGAALAAATVVGLVSSQTGSPDRSPADVTKPAVIDYGTTAG